MKKRRRLSSSLKLIALFAVAVLALRARQVWAQSSAPANVSSPLGAPIAHRFLVTYAEDGSTVTATARAKTAAGTVPGARLLRVYPTSGISAVTTDGTVDDTIVMAELRAQPGVVAVVHDYIVSAHALRVRSVTRSIIGVGAAPVAAYDTYYNGSPWGWAVRAAGGLGLGIAGGTTAGPWNTTLGTGIRIAILDSGVDPNHPDIEPNLVMNLSEIDQTSATGMPSACDDGSPVDQQGHGTWTASLAAAAMGAGTGQTVGVAPQASLLNIKVLERMPDASSAASDTATQCETGEASGELSWVLQGIEDAVANHADVISLSLGALIDLDTGEGAGLQATFDRATQAAFSAGAVIVASAGNDGLELSNPRYIELPAQSRDVLAVVASTNPACAENLSPGAQCVSGPVTLSYYSNHGAALNAIAAPGGSYPTATSNSTTTTVSGWIVGACSSGLANTTDGAPGNAGHSFGCFNLGHTQYVSAIGTSASAPLVAGAAALIRAANPSWTPAQVVDALRSRALSVASLPAAPLINPDLLP